MKYIHAAALERWLESDAFGTTAQVTDLDWLGTWFPLLRVEPVSGAVEIQDALTIRPGPRGGTVSVAIETGRGKDERQLPPACVTAALTALHGSAAARGHAPDLEPLLAERMQQALRGDPPEPIVGTVSALFDPGRRGAPSPGRALVSQHLWTLRGRTADLLAPVDLERVAHAAGHPVAEGPPHVLAFDDAVRLEFDVDRDVALGHAWVRSEAVDVHGAFVSPQRTLERVVWVAGARHVVPEPVWDAFVSGALLTHPFDPEPGTSHIADEVRRRADDGFVEAQTVLERMPRD